MLQRNISQEEEKIMQEKINSDRKTGRLLGLFFLIAMVTSMLGSVMDPILGSDNYLVNVSTNKIQMILGLISEFIAGIAVVGIAITAFPILKKYNENLARWYQGTRIFEAAITAVFVMAGFLLITLSQEFVKAGAPDASNFQIIGTLLKEARFWGYRIYIIVICSAIPVFYYVFYKTKFVPRFISVWGLVGTLLLFTGNMFSMFGITINEAIYGSVLGLNELFLSVWLLFKGVKVAKEE
jgi:hypothetical protein